MRTREVGTLVVTPRARHVGTTERFIKGPLPLAWFERAGRLKGAALHVALYLWYRVGLKRSEEVKLSLSAVARAFDLHRTSASRALSRLEEAGLVVVERATGRVAMVRVTREISARPSNEPNAEERATSTTRSRGATLNEGAPAPLTRPGAWSEPVEGPNMDTSITTRATARRGRHASR